LYELAIWSEGNLLLQHLYDVSEGDVLKHYWVIRLAKIFQKAAYLITERHSFALWDGARAKAEGIQLNSSTGWLHAVLDGKSNDLILALQTFVCHRGSGVYPD
jgi:hypothetical protein